MQPTAVTPTILDLAPSFARSLRAASKSPKTVVTYMEAVIGLAAFLTLACRQTFPLCVVNTLRLSLKIS